MKYVRSAIRWTIGAGGFIGEVSLLPVPERYEDSLRLVAQDRPVLLMGNVFVHPLRRGLGWATELVRTAVGYADKRGVDLWLYASPFGTTRTAHGRVPRLTTKELMEFYAKHGFEEFHGVYRHEMVRRCQAQK